MKKEEMDLNDEENCKRVEMGLNRILLEMEIKKQYNEIARFKAGNFTYIVKMIKGSVEIFDRNNKKKKIEAVIPDVAISLLSSMKRKVDGSRGEIPNESAIKKKVRDDISKTFGKMYSMLSKEEVEKYNAEEAMPKILDAFKSYLSKYKPEFILFKSFSDNKSKRDRFYDLTLKREGYYNLINHEGWKLYGKTKQDFSSFASKPILKDRMGRDTNKFPEALNTLRNILSNI